MLDNAAAPNFDPRRLAATGDTVYVCAPARYQDLVAPIVVAFLEQVRAGAYAASAIGANSGRAPPLTLVLDELANIAPIPDLPALVSEGGSQKPRCHCDLPAARVTCALTRRTRRDTPPCRSCGSSPGLILIRRSRTHGLLVRPGVG